MAWSLHTGALVFWEEKTRIYIGTERKDVNVLLRGLAPPGGKKPPTTVPGHVFALMFVPVY